MPTQKVKIQMSTAVGFIIAERWKPNVKQLINGWDTATQWSYYSIVKWDEG
jgi:hypothetical protein